MKIQFITMKLFVAIISLLAFIFVHPAVLADEVKVPVGQQAAQKKGIERPVSGMSKAQVERRYGQPQRTTDAIGQPPISSWEYANYRVYFEYDRVIHTVLK